MAKSIVNYSMILGLALVVFLLGAMLLSVDVDTRHPEATTIRTYYRNSTCEGTELWYSLPRGTVLVLCGVPHSLDWGGLMYRVTEHNGTRYLDGGGYEVTVFAASREYWDRVVTRDEYVPLANYPSVHRFFREWWDY